MHLLGVETGMRKGMLLINLLLMEEILHQLISSLQYPIIYKVLYIQLVGNGIFEPSTVVSGRGLRSECLRG